MNNLMQNKYIIFIIIGIIGVGIYFYLKNKDTSTKTIKDKDGNVIEVFKKTGTKKAGAKERADKKWDGESKKTMGMP